MKEEKKAKEMRQKIKDRINKKDVEKHDAIVNEMIERIGSYNVYMGSAIGQGSYGKVFKAKNDANQLLACKIISKSKLQSLKVYSESYVQEMEKRFKTESQFHKQLSGCPNVVKLYQTIENNKAYYFFMEYCQSDLSKVIKENGILSEEIALKYFSQMLEGYKSIYDKNAFHRDLKPENLLLKDDIVKISDFGFVKIFTQIDQQCKSGKNKLRTQSKVGSIKYMAPDVLCLAMNDNSDIQSKTYNAEKCDIWSMGIILYKMLYGKQPFNGSDQEQMMKKINQKQLKFPDTVELRPQVIRNAKVSPEIKRLLKKMIQKDEASRITFKKLYNTIKSYLKEKQIQKMGSGIKEENQNKEGKQGEAKNKKQELLIFYNKIIVQIYHDAVNYATFREIGVENYYEISCKLMTLVHQKRAAYLQTDEKNQKSEQVSQKIKQNISTYHNSFWGPIKNIANLGKQETLQKLLLTIYEKIRDYTEFDLLMKQVQIYLIDILLLLSLELNIVKSDYVYTWSTRSSNYKQKVILSYKQNTLTMLQRKLNQKDSQAPPEEEEEKHKKRKDKTRDKEKKHHKSKGKQKQENQQRQEKIQQVQKEKQKERSKQKKQRSQQKHRDRGSRQKKHKK